MTGTTVTEKHLIRGAAYARVSTVGPNGQDTGTQLTRLRSAAAQMGICVPDDRVFVDDGVTGRTMERPAFDRLRAAVRAREVDVILTTKIDRLGRSARGVLEFFDMVETSGIRVICVDQSIDTGSPVGKLLRTVLAAVAEFEGDLIRERTQAAMDAIKSGTRPTRSGRPVGRPRRVTPEVEARIRELRYGRGLPWAQVAIHVGIPGGTCRKVKPLPTSETRHVENGPTGFGAPSGGS